MVSSARDTDNALSRQWDLTTYILLASPPVLITSAGVLKPLDFGLAKRKPVDQKESLSFDGVGDHTAYLTGGEVNGVPECELNGFIFPLYPTPDARLPGPSEYNVGICGSQTKYYPYSTSARSTS